jgi:dTDP-4-amino-4,6-dideoxygalactose transaminase
VKGAFVIDDAAQALGATRNGSFSGARGDVGLYSLARGKALGTVEGGVIVTNSPEIAQAVRLERNGLSGPSSAHAVWLFLQLLATSLFMDPRLYWIPNSLPCLKLGTTEFDPNFSTNRLSNMARALLPLVVERLQQINQIRRTNAGTLIRALEGNPNFYHAKPLTGSQPTYPRLPLVARTEVMRSQALERFRKARIGASPLYPSAICDIPGIAAHMASPDFHRPKAENLSRRLFTVPTHPLLTNQDLNCISQILNGLAAA